MKADAYAYRDRRNRKRDFRRLWITRINAAARQNGMSYGKFMHGLKLAGIELDRKVLADIAVRDAETFRRFAETAREASPACRPPTPEPPGRPSCQDGALFRSTTTITSPHNERSRRSASSPAASGATRCGSFVAEGEDLIAAAARAGWRAGALLSRPRQRARRRGGRAARCCADGVPARLGHARARRLRAALGAGAAGPVCVALWGVNDPGNVGTVLRGALAFGAGSVALGPGHRRPVRAQGRARVDGRDVRGAAWRACATVAELPGARSRWSRARAGRWRARARTAS